MSINSTISLPRPPFWFKLSIWAANLLQLAGLVLGAWLLYLDARLPVAALWRVILMLVGWLIIYICCHASAHWLVGRLVGIEFQGYGMRGTDHPENYSGLMRSLMTGLPTFTVMTKKASLKQARPLAKALMFAAGETSTAVCSILAGWYAWQSGIPGGIVLFWVMVVFNLLSTVATARFPRGDYHKAWRALHTPAKSIEEN
jgi:hypothetical protein